MPSSQTSHSKQLPAFLLALEYQLEQIRLEQLTKNRSCLRSMAAEQQQCVELLTSAITRRIFDGVIQEWKLSTAEGKETQITQTIALIWGKKGRAMQV